MALKKEMAETILNYIRGGAFAYVAAEAAGVSDRTFHDWIARGEGRHLTRPCTPKLREFANAVRQAQAEARLGAEVRVYRDHPARWLSQVARSKPDREGWTDPSPEDSESEFGRPEDMTDEELDEAFKRLELAELEED